MGDGALQQGSSSLRDGCPETVGQIVVLLRRYVVGWLRVSAGGGWLVPGLLPR